MNRASPPAMPLRRHPIQWYIDHAPSPEQREFWLAVLAQVVYG